MANKYAAESRQAQERMRSFLMCGRKLRFDTEAAAITEGMRVYQCPYCDGWHRATSRKRVYFHYHDAKAQNARKVRRRANRCNG